MSIWLAMGTWTTADDRGYFQWLSQNWTICVVPALVFGTLLIAWMIGKIRAWTAGTPGSSLPPPTESGLMNNPEQPNPPSEWHPTRVWWPFEPQHCP